MIRRRGDVVSMATTQEALHGEGHDYVAGSPHLRHADLNRRLNAEISSVIGDVIARKGSCSVLEIGAGHGSFTATARNSGASVIVTEMSRPSCDELRHRFKDDDQVTIVYDPIGDAALTQGHRVDVVLLISVIHHIPDYLSLVSELVESVLEPSGAVITFQDPLWYPGLSRPALALSWFSYFLWRATQGEIRRGVRTRVRRLRGVYRDDDPSDMVEYHVMRDGVNQDDLLDLLGEHFREVRLSRYFSTQAPAMQAVGERFFPPNTFGITARGLGDFSRRTH